MKKLFYFIIGLLLFTLLSCSHTEKENSIKHDIISINEAVNFVKSNIIYENNGNNIFQRSDSFELLNHFEIFDKNNNPVIYVINYKLGQKEKFSLLFTDKEIHPIIAFGNGLFHKEGIVNGLKIWIQNAISTFHYIKNNNMSLKRYYEEILHAIILPDDDDPCEGENWGVNVGPLLETEWGQGCMYNDHLDNVCSNNCGHVLTGCVATAIAQILNYYNFPNNYNWNLMLNNYQALVEDTNIANDPTPDNINAVATLMDDVGQAVNMNYSCIGSSASFCNNNIYNAFINTFNYSSCSNCTNYDAYQSEDIFKNELNNGRPILIWGWGEWGNHAWVCDGYYELHTCFYDSYYDRYFSLEYFAYHMNYGWDGENNGYYNIFWDHHWDYLQKYIYNINP